jgi:hypothetical protein
LDILAAVVLVLAAAEAILDTLAVKVTLEVWDILVVKVTPEALG